MIEFRPIFRSCSYIFQIFVCFRVRRVINFDIIYKEIRISPTIFIHSSIINGITNELKEYRVFPIKWFSYFVLICSTFQLRVSVEFSSINLSILFPIDIIFSPFHCKNIENVCKVISHG